FGRHRFSRAPGCLKRCLKNSTRLHLSDFRISDRDAAAAEAEHRVEFGKLIRASSELLRVGPHEGSDFRNLFVAMWKELVQGRIKQKYGYRSTRHDFE